jgi:hypothetical protein
MSEALPQLLIYNFMSWIGATLPFHPLTFLASKNCTDSDLGDVEVTISCLFFCHQKHAVNYA